MTRPAPPAGPGLGRCFEVFTVSAFGLETLRAYAAPGEQDRLKAFRLRRPLPGRPAPASRWLARIAATTAAGKSWHRVRVLDRPLSEDECSRLLGYRECAGAGLGEVPAHEEVVVLPCSLPDSHARKRR